MDFLDVLHHPVEIFDQSVMIHKHLATGGSQQERGYDGLFQREIDFPFFVRENREGQLEFGFEIIGSHFGVCNGYRQELDVIRQSGVFLYQFVEPVNYRRVFLTYRSRRISKFDQDHLRCDVGELKRIAVLQAQVLLHFQGIRGPHRELGQLCSWRKLICFSTVGRINLKA
jgi:hypothetical protein